MYISTLEVKFLFVDHNECQQCSDTDCVASQPYLYPIVPPVHQILLYLAMFGKLAIVQFIQRIFIYHCKDSQQLLHFRICEGNPLFAHKVREQVEAYCCSVQRQRLLILQIEMFQFLASPLTLGYQGS